MSTTMLNSQNSLSDEVAEEESEGLTKNHFLKLSLSLSVNFIRNSDFSCPVSWNITCRQINIFKEESTNKLKKLSILLKKKKKLQDSL